MPTYDYRCKSCGHEMELFQSMTESPKRKCPACGRTSLERLIGTGAGVIFKGSGFYETDYRSDSYKKAAEAEAKPAATTPEAKPAASNAADAKKPDPKPEKKPEPEPRAKRSAPRASRARRKR